ncbi:MAG: amidohydrolase family protein [Desulfobacterales bacterium]|nr:amidohydrolase family protein [Desulfobacterales bacterium]
MHLPAIDFHSHLGGHNPCPFRDPFSLPPGYHPLYWMKDRAYFNSLAEEAGMALQFKVGLLLSRLGLDLVNNKADINKQLKTSRRIEKLVVLAFPPVVTDGKPDYANTPLYVSNRAVMALARDNAKIIPGISINPLADDAEPRLEELMAESKKLPNGGKIIFKLFPSVGLFHADGIDSEGNEMPYRQKLLAFYDRLAGCNIPVMVHTGLEEVVKDIEFQYFMEHGGDVAKLVPLIETGVTVILAHSGYDPSYQKAHGGKPNQYREVKAAMQKYPNVYADIAGAFSTDYNFIGTVAELMEDDHCRRKLIHASDYPVGLADPEKMLSSLANEDPDNIYVQKAIRVYQAIAAEPGLNQMTALDGCARMAALSLQAMGATENSIEEYFSNGARVLGY